MQTTGKTCSVSPRWPFLPRMCTDGAAEERVSKLVSHMMRVDPLVPSPRPLDGCTARCGGEVCRPRETSKNTLAGTKIASAPRDERG